MPELEEDAVNDDEGANDDEDASDSTRGSDIDAEGSEIDDYNRMLLGIPVENPGANPGAGAANGGPALTPGQARVQATRDQVAILAAAVEKLGDNELAARLYYLVKHETHEARIRLLTTDEWVDMDLAVPEKSVLNLAFITVLRRRLGLAVHLEDDSSDKEEGTRVWKSRGPQWEK